MEAKRRKLSESNSQQFDTFVDVPKLSSPPKYPEAEDGLKDKKILKRPWEMEEFPLESLPAEVLIVIFEHRPEFEMEFALQNKIDQETEDFLKDEMERTWGAFGTRWSETAILQRTREMEEFPLESLPAEILSVIFEHLPMYDRLLIERVSKRWQKIAKEYSWSKTTRISVYNGICYWLDQRSKFAEELAGLEQQRRFLPESEVKVEQFPALTSASLVPPEALEWIFHRCGAFIRHIDFTHAEEMINQLDMLPNLHSLVLNDIHFDNPETQQLVDIACALPNLKLLRFNGKHMQQDHENVYPSIGQLLFGLQNLEVLEIADLPGYELGYLPNSLKRLEISDVYIPFVRLAEWCPGLMSLKVDYTIEFVQEAPFFDGLTENCGLITKLKLMTNLKELDIYDYNIREIAHFPQFLNRLPKLQSLSIDTFCDSKQILEVINKNIPGLRHLSINVHEDDNEETFPSLENLKNLRSIIVKSDDEWDVEESEPGFSQFFERLLTTHPLEYFETDYVIPEASLCNALLKCPTLRRITWANKNIDPAYDFDTLLKKLTEIHGNASPSGEYDKRILHINNPGFGESKNPKHPWLRLHLPNPPNPITAEFKKLKSVF